MPCKQPKGKSVLLMLDETHMPMFSSSDASSEYLSAVEVTDSEDTGRNGSIIGQEPAGQQVAVVGGSYTGVSPMIIMNNIVLKQVKYN
uniref:Uncharacterized protein n=1 Tax=Nothobranchius furzeri TaxID=105023 RepID=A0A8C6PL84_NOTFU